MGCTYSVSAVTIKIPILLFFVSFRKSIVLREFLLIKLYLPTIDLFWITLPAESLRSFLDKIDGDSVRRVILLKNKLEKNLDFFYRNHGLTPLESTHVLDITKLTFLSSLKTCFLSRPLLLRSFYKLEKILDFLSETMG